MNPITPFKTILSEQTKAYQDRHRSIHLYNQAIIKKRAKIEKALVKKEAEEKKMKEITEQRIVDKEVAERYRLLNVI